jgi:hypothetical protein
MVSLALLSMCMGSPISQDQPEVEARELWVALLSMWMGSRISKGQSSV